MCVFQDWLFEKNTMTNILELMDHSIQNVERRGTGVKPYPLTKNMNFEVERLQHLTFLIPDQGHTHQNGIKYPVRSSILDPLNITEPYL